MSDNYSEILSTPPGPFWTVFFECDFFRKITKLLFLIVITDDQDLLRQYDRAVYGLRISHDRFMDAEINLPREIVCQFLMKLQKEFPGKMPLKKEAAEPVAFDDLHILCVMLRKPFF